MSDIWTTLAEKNYQALRDLLGANPHLINVRTHYGDSPLTYAIQDGDIEAIRLLLNFGADPNEAIDKASAISSRVDKGRLSLTFAKSSKVIDLLVDIGADVNKVDPYGRSVLFIVSRSYDIERIEYLRSKGAKLRTGELQKLLENVNDELEYRKVQTPDALERMEELEKMLNWCKNYV